MKTINNILKADRKIITEAHRSFQTSATILNYLDIIAQRLGKMAAATNQTISIEIIEPNVALAVMYSKPVNFNVVGAETSTGNLSLGFQDTDNATVLASAKIPKETFQNKSQIVYTFLFRNDILFQTGRQLEEAFEAGKLLQSLISSKILAISVGKEKVENLTFPVLFVFKKTKKNFPKESQIVDNLCTFWDPNKRKCNLN